MADLFGNMFSTLNGFGFFDIAIFMLVVAVFYGLLRKSKVLGDSPVVIGVISLSIGFMLIAFRFVTGMSLVTPIAMMFAQWTSILLVFVFGFVAASLFYPDMLSWLPKVFHSRSILMIMLVLGLTIMITSGLVQSFFVASDIPDPPGTIPIPDDTIIIIAGVVIFMVIVIIASSLGLGGGA
jgi:hypothetical protein